jgi:hypothetical protein
MGNQFDDTGATRDPGDPERSGNRVIAWMFLGVLFWAVIGVILYHVLPFF